MKARPFAALMAGLLLAGAAHADQASAIRAEGAWIRVMPAGLPAGGYVTLHNEGGDAATLTGASSTQYGHVMLHESSTEGGMGRMKAIDRLVIPAHGEVALAPGGYHLMLMKGAAEVRVGSSVSVILQFADGSKTTVDFLARPANAVDAGTQAPAGHHHDG